MYKYKLKIKHPLLRIHPQMNYVVKEKMLLLLLICMYVYINNIHAIIIIHTEYIKFNSDS